MPAAPFLEGILFVAPAKRRAAQGLAIVLYRITARSNRRAAGISIIYSARAGPPPRDIELVAEQHILNLKPPAQLEQVGHDDCDSAENGKHHYL